MTEFKYHVMVLSDDTTEWELTAGFFTRTDANDYAMYHLDGCKTKIVECDASVSDGYTPINYNLPYRVLYEKHGKLTAIKAYRDRKDKSLKEAYDAINDMVEAGDWVRG